MLDLINSGGVDSRIKGCLKLQICRSPNGYGGTGAYILDLVSKIEVAEIHIYDGDCFNQHNAFRAPGACSVADLARNLTKVDYLSEIYSKMHKHITAHNCYIDENNVQDLSEMSFVFLCVDNNYARTMIAKYLTVKEISFIDVGLGVLESDNLLTAQIRVTSVTKDYNKHSSEVIPADNNDNNDYATNIQIAELNSLNAAFAVIKWKKMCGFYADFRNEHNSIYKLTTNIILNDNITT